MAMTAQAMKGDEERCRESVMDDYVSKPVSRKACTGVAANPPGIRS